MKKNIIILLFMIFLSIPIKNVFAETISSNAVSENSVKDFSMLDDNKKINQYDFEISNSLKKNLRSIYPSFYDGRKLGYITMPKNQWPYGSCWAFSVISCAESNLIKKGLADAAIDLSELHLAYFTYQNFRDPLENITADSTSIGNDITSILNYGGDNFSAISQLSKWSGVVSESVAPYSWAEEGIVPSNHISNYSEYRLKNAVFCDNDENNRNNVKNFIIEYGSVESSYYSSGNYYNYIDGTSNYYIPNVPIATHSISIIGWDDNYSKDKFNVAPPNNGAWLCKDSNQVQDGYIWISYDTVMTAAAAFEFDVPKNDFNYQYDGGNTNTLLLSSVQKKANSCMNIFTSTASKDTLEKLDAIYFGANSVGKTYNIKVYVNPVLDQDGNMISFEYESKEISKYIEYCGFYQVEIPDQDIFLSYGDRFAIEIIGDDILNLFISSTGYNSLESMKKEECYYSIIEKDKKMYKDLYTLNATPRIKAYTNKTSIPCATEVSINNSSISMDIDSTYELFANVTAPDNALSGITWHSSDPSVATVSNGVIKAIKPGDVIVTAKSQHGNATAICNVKVIGVLATSLVSEDKVNLKSDQTYKLKVILSEQATIKELEYISLDPSVATVSNGVIKAIKPGITDIIINTKDGSNLSAKTTVTVSDDVLTEGLFLYVTDYNMQVGMLGQLSIVRIPDQVTNKEIKIDVSNSNVIKLDNMQIKAIAPGESTITVTALDSGIFETIKIFVYGEKSKDNEISNPDPIEDIKIGTYFTSNNIKYKIIGKKEVSLITPIKKNIKIISIPKQVLFKGKKFNVISIGKRAFYGCKKLNKVNISSNVKEIYNYAFANTNIKKIIIPSKVTFIGNKAFYNCKSLVNVTLGTGIKTIGSKAFYNCKKLKIINIKSKSLKKVDKLAFGKIHSCAVIKVPKTKINLYKKILKKSVISKKIKIK